MTRINGNGNGEGYNNTSSHNALPTSQRQSLFPEGLTDNQLAHLEEVIGNALMVRQEFFKQLMDPRRSIDDECGYPSSTSSVSAELYRQLYDRESIANRVVQVMPKESWQAQPLVYEDESAKKVTPFEEAWDTLGQSLNQGQSWHQDEEGSPIWEHLMRADILSGIGHFGVIMLGIDDGKNLQDPVDGALVIANHKYEPIYAEVPVRNQRGEIVRNAEGLYRTIKKQIGTRVSTTTQSLPPDSPPTENELTALREMVENKSIVIRQGVFDKCGYREESKRYDAQYLNTWESTSAYSPTTNKSSFISPLPEDLPLVSPTLNDAWGETGSRTPTTVAKDSQGRSIHELQGTDQQYAWQGSAPPQSLAGTDQQYFGVQFGPSEQPSAEPAGRGKGGRKLLFIRAFDESLVQIVRYEWNIRNPRFGMPVMYRITLNDPREQHTGVGLPLATVFVHWSRIIHLADNRGSSEIFGVPRMRPVLNRLLDLRKIYGASAEGYWKSCFTGLAFSTHPQLGGDVLIDEAKTRDMVEQYQNGLQRFLMLMGMSAQTLAPSVVDPASHVALHIEAICIQLGIPVRVFKGSERGELASSQDDDAWLDRLHSRQHYYITPRVIVPTIDRLISVGALPAPKGYSVRWPDLDSLGDKDKVAILLQKTQAYAAYIAGNLEAVIPPLDYMTRFDTLTEEEAQEIIDAAAKAHENEDTMTAPPQVGGRPKAPEEGQSGFRPPQPPTIPPIPTTGPALAKPGGAVAQKNATEQAKPMGNVFCPTGEGGGVDSSCGKEWVDPTEINKYLDGLDKRLKPHRDLEIFADRAHPVDEFLGGDCDVFATLLHDHLAKKGIESEVVGLKVARQIGHKDEVWHHVFTKVRDRYFDVTGENSAKDRAGWTEGDPIKEVSLSVKDLNHARSRKDAPLSRQPGRRDRRTLSEVFESMVGTVENVFCPTGAGGGVDPSCGRGGIGAVKPLTIRHQLKLKQPHKLPEFNRLAGQLRKLNKAVKDGNAGPATIAKAADIKNKLEAIRVEVRALPQPHAPAVPAPAPPVAPVTPVAGLAAVPTVGGVQVGSSYQTTPVRDVRNLGGGINGSYKVTLENGEKGAWKPVDGEAHNLRREIPQGTYYHREAAAYSVAAAVGLHDLVPVTVEREVNGVKGSIMQWRERAKVAGAVFDGTEYDGQKDCERAAAFDYLIGNTDRHSGNWMVGTADTKLTLIDHGLSFPKNNDEFRSYLFEHAKTNDFKVPAEVTSWDRATISTALKQHGITSDEREAVYSRLRVLQAAAGKSFRSVKRL